MLDEFRSTSITWDKATRRIYSPITANASDSNGRKLNIQVVNSGQVENLTGATLHLYWETKDKVHDGLDAFDASDISKGEFELFYTTGMLSNVGELNATLVLVDSTGKVVSDWFKITVTRGINEGAIESENSFSSLTQALIDISNLEQNYTPRLNDLTAQLAQTPKKTEPGWANLNTFDESTRSVLLGLEPGQINAVLGYKNVTIPNTAFIEQSTNQFNPDSMAYDGIVISAEGAEVLNSSYQTSEFEPILPNQDYTLGNVNYISLYDENKNFISRNGIVDGAIFVKTPPNARFRRISRHIINNPIDVIQINQGVTLLPYEPYFKPRITPRYLDVILPDKSVDSDKLIDKSVKKNHLDFIVQSTNLFNKDTIVDNTAISIHGEISTNTRYAISDKITVQADSPHTSIYARYIAEYNKDGAFLGRINPPEGSAGESFVFTTKTNTAEVILVVDKNNHDISHVQLNEGVSLKPYEEYYERIDPKLIGLPKTDYDSVKENKFIFDMSIDGVFSTAEEFDSQYGNTLSTDSTAFYDRMDAIVARHSDYVTKSLGTNEATGKPVYRYDFIPKRPLVVGSNPQEMPKVLLIGGTHYEKTAIFTLINTMEQICDNWQSDPLLEFLRFNIHFIVIPVLNPWGIDNVISRNSNNVDLNWNYPAGWVATGEEAANYSGPYPLSEKETMYVDTILKNDKPAVAIDFHNFFGTVQDPPTYFVWTLSNNKNMKTIGDALMRRLTRKWKKELPFIPNDPEYFVGQISDAGPGRFSRYASEMGIEYSAIYEVCERYWMDSESLPNDENVMKLGLEAFVNYLLMILHDYSK